MFNEKKAKTLLDKYGLKELYNQMEIVIGKDSDDMNDDEKERAIFVLYKNLRIKGEVIC